MRNIKMSEIISRSVTRSSAILFNPFRLKKWLILVFIALFAGSLSFNGNLNLRGSPSQNKAAKNIKAQTAQQTDAAQSQPAATREQKQAKQAAPSRAGKVAIIVMTIVFFLILFLIILMTWVGAHFRFIWFNAIASNDASIIGPFHKHRLQGNSLFKASLIISAVFIFALFSIVAWCIVNAIRAGAFQPNFTWSVHIAMHIFAVPLIMLLFYILLALIVSVFIDHFVVMIMALEKMKFIQAFKKALQIYSKNIGDLILFNILLFLLWIFCSVVVLVIAIIAVILFVIIALILGFIGYFIFMSLLKMKMVFIIYCIVIGIPWLASLFIFMFCAQLPFAVFLRCYSIEYLCSLEGGYTYAMLESYAKERSSERSRGIVIVPVIFIVVVLTAFIFGLLAAIAIPNFIKARATVEAKMAETCKVNLRAIETAKSVWARGSGANDSTVPEWDQLVPGYLLKKPVCPKSGAYSIEPVSVLPKCSIGNNETTDVSDDHIIQK